MRGWMIVVGVAICTLSTGCKEDGSPKRKQVAYSRTIMGTFSRLCAVGDDQAEASVAVAAGYNALERVNRLMSDYVEDSEIGKLNSLAEGASLVVSPETFHCIAGGLEVSRVTGGAFDITCRPLVSLWKRCGGESRLPTADELDKARYAVGWQKVVVDESAQSVSFGVAGVQLDLGGVAKGYGLDLAAKAMVDVGASDVLVDVGGDVVAIGRNREGRPWRIGIKHPFEEGLIGVLAISGKAVATSGDQQRFYEIDGHRYSHIIDPRTGQPAAEAPCVTVIADDGLTADAWGTALSVLSVAEGQRLVADGAAGSIEVMWMTRGENGLVLDETPGFDSFFVDQ